MTDYTYLDVYIEQAEAAFNEWLEQNTRLVPVTALGVDYRAGGNVRVSDQAVLVNNDSLRSFLYYGGGEYVDESQRTTFCNWTVFWAGDERVDGWLEHLEEHETA